MPPLLLVRRLSDPFPLLFYYGIVFQIALMLGLQTRYDIPRKNIIKEKNHRFCISRDYRKSNVSSYKYVLCLVLYQLRFHYTELKDKSA